MSILLRAWAIFVVAAKRLISQRWLAIATALGLLISVALTLSVPLYADAVYYRVLREELTQAPSGEQITRPPFAFMFRYIGAWAGSKDWEDVQAADTYLSNVAGPSLGLPQYGLVRYFKTDNFQVFPQEDIAYATVKDPLTWASFAFISDLHDHINLLEGSFPTVAASAQDSTVEVMISEAIAFDLGLQVGEEYVAFARRRTGDAYRNIQIPIRIAGVWQATDPTEEFWFYTPQAFKDVFFVPEETFMGRLSPYMDDEVYLGLWYLLMDGSDVHSSEVLPMLGRTNAVQQRAAALLPDLRLDVSPVDALRRYWQSARLLTVLLYAFSVPIVGLILAFIGLVVGLSVSRQRNEIAVLRSRGATALQVIGIATLEGLLLGFVALVLGAPVGAGIAQVIGKARSFLDFGLQSDLRVGVTMQTLYFGLAAVGLALVAQVVPTIGAATHTIVTYKQDRARSMRAPWWQRAWLDVLLLIPAAYGAYMLRQQGTIAMPIGEGGGIGDPFQNPLLFLVPALGIFALTLFVLRILPLIMSLVAWITAHLNGTAMLMASRQLARTPSFYAAPLMLLTLTVSLSTYTASLARTLDSHLYSQTYYRYGADMALVESGESTETTGGPPGGMSMGAGAQEETTQSTTTEDPGPRWLFLPVSEHLKVSGVDAAARVGRYTASSRLSGGIQEGVFIGVDRVDFSQVSYWRHDFATYSLGALMNGLALENDGVLVPRSYAAQHSVRIGDTFRLRVNTYGQSTEWDVKIVGYIDMFPTWYPTRDGPLFVGNLETLFERAGGQYPYDVWVNTPPDADYERIVSDVRKLGLAVIDWRAPLLDVAREQRRPERQGLFGVLSVGFLAAALLTVLGFLLYAFFSFRRRFIELGILRAIGLSARQMTSFLAWELAFLILVGLGIGTVLGVEASRLFIPYLQVGTGPMAQTPPFVVEIAWPAIIQIYILFGLLFVVALGVLAALLLRMKIFQAVKLGETA
ncbi:MAG: FtsX-like permease family protein [Chloroflexi bacterium]|nr:FtsX-like permease family protein [Chloroflexota bacterium]